MSPNHSEVIEAMAQAMFVTVTDGMREDVKAALRAAAERGWVLAKRPERITMLAEVPPHVQDESMGNCRGAYRHGWSQCLDAIEIIEMEQSE